MNDGLVSNEITQDATNTKQRNIKSKKPIHLKFAFTILLLTTIILINWLEYKYEMLRPTFWSPQSKSISKNYAESVFSLPSLSIWNILTKSTIRENCFMNQKLLRAIIRFHLFFLLVASYGNFDNKEHNVLFFRDFCNRPLDLKSWIWCLQISSSSII